MRRSKAEYQKKCKIKTVTFYTNKEDQELYEFANKINFQQFVKLWLKYLKPYKNVLDGLLITITIKPKEELGGDNGNIQDN